MNDENKVPVVAQHAVPLRAQVLDRFEQLPALEAEWSALSRSFVLPLPFTTPQWVMCWWKHIAARGPWVKDFPHVITFRNGEGALVGIAPFMRTSRPAFGPLRTRCLQLMGADPYVTELRTVLFAPGFEEAGFKALWRELERTSDDWDWVKWHGVPEAHTAFLPASDRLRWVNATPAYTLELDASWDELRQRLGRNLKESLRKCYNSLKRDNLTFSFEARTGPELGPALSDFFRLHALRARLDGTVSHINVFASPQSQAFLRDYCEQSRPGSAVVFTLKINDVVVATRVGFILDGTLYLYFSGYDPAYGKYSVMTTTVAESLKWAISQGLRTVNLSFGTDVSKTRWDPTPNVFKDAVLLSPRLHGRLVHQAYDAATQAKKFPVVRSLAGFLMRPTSAQP